MHPPPESLVCALGHAASADELIGRGVTARQLRAAVQAGVLRHLPRGIYTCSHASVDQRAAAAAHASITCLSALRPVNVWTGTDTATHLQLPANASHSRPLFDEAGFRIRYHWAGIRFDTPDGRPWRVGPLEAVWRAIRCLDEGDAIACLESAVHEGVLTQEQVRRLCLHAPRRLQKGITELEFTAGSGQETIVRRRLRNAGYTVVAQEQVRGIPYSQDLVVEDCVALETDGKKWHGTDRFHADRNRDVHVEGLGRRTLRLTAQMVLYDWETTFTTIERVVADAQRDRARRSGRVIIGFNDPG
jgi:very-short-patch-repair endonuclease